MTPSSQGRTPTRPQAILFDLGDTVMVEERFDAAAGIKHLFAISKSPARGTDSTTQLNAAIVRYEEIRRLRETSLIEFPYQSFFTLLEHEFGLSFAISPSELEAEFFHAVVTLIPKSGIESVLAFLQQAGLPCGIVSNAMFSGPALNIALTEQHLAHHFRFLISSADLGLRKPHPKLFEIAAKQLDLHPRDIWFVGDSYENDIRGSANVGMFPIWLKPAETVVSPPQPPHYEAIDSWESFLPLLSEALG